MKIWRGQFLASIFIGVSLSLTGCKKPAESAADSPVIKVGGFASLNGSEAAFGRSSHNGTQLAVDEINAAGGVLGKQIELITEDDQSKDGESATAAKGFSDLARVAQQSVLHSL